MSIIDQLSKISDEFFSSFSSDIFVEKSRFKQGQIDPSLTINNEISNQFQTLNQTPNGRQSSQIRARFLEKFSIEIKFPNIRFHSNFPKL